MDATKITKTTLPNGWKMNLHPHCEVFPPHAIDQSLKLITRWVGVFPKEPTWVQNQHGQPSLIVRIDGVLDSEGNLKPYEVEDRPCGIGVSSTICPEFARLLQRMRSAWPDISWVVDPDRVTDDDLWLGTGMSCQEALGTDGLLLVRSRPENRSFYPLAHRAVSTVMREGDKACMGSLGLLHDATWVPDSEEVGGGYIKPEVHHALVVKPSQGTRARAVGVYLNGTQWPHRKRKGDVLNLGALERRVRQGGVVCQPFVPPMRCEFLGPAYAGWNMIYRCYFGFMPTSREWICMGGVWMALDSLIVHGTPDSISGPLRIQY